MDSSGEACLDLKPTEGSSMAAHIPLEVITEILAKLPVKSLLKFRLVCKSWCSFISTRQFVRKHLSSSNSSSIPKRVIQLCNGFLKFYSLHDSKVVQESSQVDFRSINNVVFKDFSMMGYCDGLACVKAYIRYKTHIFIWNPNTSDSKLLPYIPGVVEKIGFSLCRYSYGFGYDYNSDDYKVLIAIPPKVYHDRMKSCKSMMFTLRTNSWRRIQDFPSHNRSGMVPSATFVSGALHWTARNIENFNSWSIISLDLTTETYMEVPQPEYYGSTPVGPIGIGASSTGCLCLSVFNAAAPHRSYDFWVMKEYGVRESWTISARIPFMVDGECVIGLTPVTWLPENGDILFQMIGKLATYNINKNSVRHHQLRQPGQDNACSHGDVYVESLISPNAYSSHGAEETSRLNINVRSMTRDQV